jgi:hypothetical protein
MTHAKNAHPEWGYLAPAPSLMRATRIALIATAVGATVGCVVVLSLVDRSAGQTSVADRTLVQPMQTAAAPASAPENAQRQAAGRNESTKGSGANSQLQGDSATASQLGAAARKSSTNATVPGAAGIASPNEVPPETTAVRSAAETALPSKTVKKRRVAAHYPPRGGLLGFVLSERWGEPYSDQRWGGSYKNGGRYQTRGYGGG